jgi:tRNA(Ile)-lysidine synthase
MKPSAKVRHYIERHAMLKEARGVVVAVSGGADSIALLDMLVRLRQRAEGQRRKDSGDHLSPLLHSPTPALFFIHIAHLNHKLRGADSDQDAEFVRRLAARLSLPVTIECADVRAAAERSRRGIEEMAREIRYHFLLRVARATGADRVAAGHTMSDQAETFLLRLARGAGLRGLAAMRPVSPAHEFAGQGPGAGEQGPGEEGSLFLPDDSSASPSCLRPPAPGPRPLLIRPLLAITRDEVEAHCTESGLDYRTDATNVAGDFTRNRVRRDVLPALQAINPQVVVSIARAAEHLAADEDALAALALSFLDAARVEPPGKASNLSGHSIAAYRLAALREQPVGLQQRMLIEAIRRARAFAGAGTHGEVTRKHIAAVQSLLDQAISGKRVRLPGGLEVWREYDALLLKRVSEEEGEGAARDYAFELSAAHSRIEAGGLLLTIERCLPAGQLPALINEARRLKVERGRDWLMAILDDEALPASLLVRPRRRGARARISGHRKTIKLKKLMIDHTIPASRRAAWPVVMTPDDCYVWSPGLPLAVDFAARGETRTLAILRALNV